MPQELNICMQPETIPTTSLGTVLEGHKCFETSEDFNLKPIVCPDDVHIVLSVCSACVIIVCSFVPRRWTALVFLTFWSTRFCVDPSASPVETPSLRCSIARSPPSWTPSQVLPSQVFVFKWVYVCVICISDYVHLSHQRVITRCTRSPPRMPKTSRTFCQSIWTLSSSRVSEN